MISGSDLAPIPAETARTLVRSTRDDVAEEIVGDLSARCLEKVMHVVLQLTGVASTLDLWRRDRVLDLCEELDTAVRAAREVVLGPAPTPGPAAPVPTPRSAAGDDVELALLDRDGVVVWTNRAWDEFCRANGGDPRSAGAGCSYLAACDAATDDPSAEVGRAIRLAARGDLSAPVRVVVPCAAPERPRAFDVLVSTRRDDAGRVLGATIALSEARHASAEPARVAAR